MGALITLVVAATVVSALWFVVDSTVRQEVPVERYAGVPLVVGTGGIAGAIPPELVATVDALPEVAATVPDLSFAANLSVRGVPVEVAGDQYPRPWGHGWSSARLTPFHIREGRPPRAENEVVVDARLAEAARIRIGDRVEVGVSGTVRRHEVVGVATTPTAWRHQSALFFEDGHAAKLTGRGSGTDALGVYPRPGTGVESLQAAVARVVQSHNAPGARTVRIASGADRSAEEGNIVPGGGFNTLWFLVWTTALVATGMVAAAMGLSVRRRGTEIAVLRAVGARPGQIRRLLLTEGMLFSVVATAVAVPLGMLLAPVIAARFRDFGTVNAAFEVSYHPLPMLWTFALTMAVAVLASLMAVRRALRIRPGDALGEAPAEGGRLGRGRLLTGLALLAMAAVLSLLQLRDLVDFGGPLGNLAVQFAGMILIVASVGLVAPWFVLLVGRLLRGGAARTSRAGGFLAVANVVFNHRRFAGAVGSLTLGVTLVGVIVSTQLFYDWRAAEQSARDVSADHVLKPPAVTGGLSEALRRRVQDHEDTSAAVGIRSLPLTVTAEGRPPVQGPLPPTTATVVTGDITRVLDLSVRGRPLGDLGKREVAISDSLAARDKTEVGSRLRVRFPGAAKDEVYMVATIYPDTPELTSALFSRAGFTAAHLSPEPYNAVYVRGADLGESAGPGSVVESLSKREYVWRKTQESAERNRVLPYLSVLIALFCLVAGVNSLCLALLDRRREFTGMRHIGMRRGQVMRMVCWESVLTVVPVLVLALAATAWTVLVHSASEPTGLANMLLFIPFDWLAPLGGGALLGTLAGSLLVVRAAIRNER
ncbi:ABC transporter permease [Nonomuraea sp. NPDC046570]|uniref:ABC transporter permease n=1 Tax=Nonomuraea sp. NPDC046570 TaxID=3155255 RepID=UPI0033E43C99